MIRASRAARLALAHPLEGPLLQDAQQLHLQVQRQVADLVEEERAACRDLEAARALADRAGEGPAHVAEQLALQQLAGQRAAVDRRRTARRAAASARGSRARATSLPVPLSPVSSTVASLCSRFSIRRKTRSIAGERPIRPGKGDPPPAAAWSSSAGRSTRM